MPYFATVNCWVVGLLPWISKKKLGYRINITPNIEIVLYLSSTSDVTGMKCYMAL